MLGLDLALTSRRGGAWWPQGAVYAADFVGDRYMRDGNAITAAEAYGFARASSKWARNAAGEWSQFAPDRLARTDLGASIEPAGSNIVPNAALAGAAVGVLGAGGSLPTGWITTGVLNTEVVALTSLLGLPAIRLRLFGVAGATFHELNMLPAPAVATPGAPYAASIFTQLHTGPTPTIEVRQGTETDAFVAANVLSPAASTVPARAANSFSTLANTGRLRIRLSLTLVVGQSYDCEITVACPQIETGNRVTSPLFSVRSSDAVEIEGPAVSFMIALRHDDGTMSVVSPASGTYHVPTNLGRTLIEGVTISTL